MVRVRTLQRLTLPRSLLHEASPAATHSHRVAAHFVDDGAGCNVYIASGVDVYCVKMDLKETGVDSGKEDMLIPVDSEVAGAWQVEQCPHRAEIQSIALTPSPSDEGFLLGSVDAFGRLVVTSLNSDIPGSSYTAGPQDPGVGEGWWAGIVFNRDQPTLAAVGRGLAKAVDLYDKDIFIRTLRTLQHPTSLTFLHGPMYDNGSMLAVTEGPQLSIWDLRQAERGGCVQRMLGAFSGESLNAVACSSEGLVAIGGAERVVLVMDPLKWTPRSRWTSCLKYEVTGLSFSAVDPGLMYVHGLDYEVLIFVLRGKPFWNFVFKACPRLF
ncbi:hypothetical protein KC19_12G009600 [Ceratodon purpureus]|uniref:Uncharacterized protein n=1 Tax=Ceratodon purpureus TaxID=3225 RepID=A0A8T0G2C8_CERPU|nr:hypothetical protein KC19_12G009600 [Ceratodon purpureus]